MAIIPVVTFQGEPDILAWKSPGNEFVLGTQVVVNQSQEALFFKGGEALDVFSPGTHTLTTGNIPLLSRLINLPFGGKTPFTAEVWYVNKVANRDMKWGTPAPIPVEDCDSKLPLHVRANGTWGLRVADTRSFITQIVGTQRLSDSSQISRYFIGEITKRLTSVLVRAMEDRSFLKIGGYLDELSELVREKITKEFERFGIEIINFDIVSVNIPEDEQKQLLEIRSSGLAEATRLKNLAGVDQNVLARVGMLDIGKTAAANEGSGNAAGMMNTMMGAAMGLGPGMMLGQQMGQQFQQMPIQPQQAPVQPQPAPQNDVMQRLQQLKQLFDAGLLAEAEYNTKKAEIIKDL
jgi:membrane protease subunit (stomatin/prohibitin family)